MIEKKYITKKIDFFCKLAHSNDTSGDRMTSVWDGVRSKGKKANV